MTTNIEEEVHDQWVKWMKEEHIPAMIKTGKFINAIMSRVDVVESMGGITYSIQYKVQSTAILERCFEEDAHELRAQTKLFDGKFVSFRTEMEIVHEES